MTDGIPLAERAFRYTVGEQSEEERLAEEAKAREWCEDFKAKADPALLEWLTVMDGNWETEPLPWQWWEARLDAARPDMRDWLVRMSGTLQDGPAPGP